VVESPARDSDRDRDSGPVGGALVGSAAAVLVGVGVLVAVSGWHLTQGTASQVGASDLVNLALGRGDQETLNILVASRLPRMLAGLCVGTALGVAGALLQSLARNALASPDTIGVNAGAYFAIAVTAAFGLQLPILAGGAVAFVGGLLAAALVLALAGGSGGSTTRLILAGSAVAMALGSATGALLILFEQQTTGLFVWGNGVLTQIDLSGVRAMAPVIVLGIAGAMLLTRRLDLLGLGDDMAGVLGVPVRRTRILGVVAAVLLASSAVALAGPIGFVGLAAPVIVRLLARAVRGLHRHAVVLPLSGVMGAVIVLLADVAVRALVGAEEGTAMPTGVATTLLGALVLVLVARRSRDSGPTRQPPTARARRHTRLRFRLFAALGVAVVAASLIAGLLLGYTWLLTGDVVNWLQGNAVPGIEFALSERAPRVLAALAAGTALALAGAAVQAVCRNPLAEPGILGITAGAGLGAVVLLLVGGTAVTVWAMSGGAVAGAVLTFALVYGIAWRTGLDSDRLVLVGVGLSAGTTALTTFLLVRANPWDTPLIYTWLSGTTYGRSFEQVVPLALTLLVVGPVLLTVHRELDLMGLDEDTPRLVGIPLEGVRLLVLTGAALLTAASVIAVGVVAFVGLVAPHAARALVGGRHARVLPMAMLIGAAFLSLADTLGRTVIAPAQVPAGLVVAVIGAPYFVYLLHRSRA